MELAHESTKGEPHSAHTTFGVVGVQLASHQALAGTFDLLGRGCHVICAFLFFVTDLTDVFPFSGHARVAPEPIRGSILAHIPGDE